MALEHSSLGFHVTNWHLILIFTPLIAGGPKHETARYKSCTGGISTNNSLFWWS
jgi:hypothetical protein